MKRILLAVLLASAGLHTFAAEYAFDYRNPQAWAGKPSLAVGDQVALTLSEDLAFTLQIVSAPPPGIAGQSFIARDQNSSASAVIKVNKNGIRVAIDDYVRARQYTVRCKDGTINISERDTNHESGGECGTCGGSLGVVPARLGEEPSSDASKESDKSADSRVAARKLLGASSSFPLAEQKCIVDVLVAFDQGAKTWAEAQGEWDTLEDCAEAAVQRMNMVLQNSTLGDDYSYRLAGITVLDDTDTDVGSALGKSLDGLGGYARLRAEQAACGADVPVVFIDTGKSSGTRGVSYALMSTNETSIANWWDHAFASCHIASSFDEYTMTHEVGHCLGAGHSNYNWNNENFCNESGYKGVGTPQSCDFSAGYHFTDYTNGLYHTIMGYNDGADGRRYAPTPYFSSPNITPPEHEVVIGTSTNDNVRVLRHTCTYVANWRNPVKPGQYDVLAFDDQSREILDGRIFTGTLPVSLSSNIDGATIYYTTDGSTPTPDSNTYSAPISITDTTTLTVSAVTNGVAASVRSFKVFKVDSPVIANDSSIAWRTSSTHPWLYTSVTDWTGSDKHVIRGGLTGNMRGETFLKAEVEGPKQLSFRVKSKFHYSKSTVPAQYASQYTHCNFFVDEKAVVTMVEPQSDWIVVKTDIPEGTHTLLFSFIQQTAPNGASDGMWLDDMRLDDSASVSIVPPSSDWDGKTLPGTAVTANVNSEYYSFYAAGNFEDPLNPFVQSLSDRTAVVGQVQTTSNAKCVYGISTGTESSAKTFSGDVYALVNGGRLDVASPTMKDYGSNFSYTSGDALLQLGGNCAVTYALGGNYGSGSRTIPGNVGITVKDDAQVGSIIGGWTMDTSSNGIQGNTSLLVLNNQTNNLTRTSGYKYVPEELTGYIIGASYADGGGYGSSTVSGNSSVRLAPTSSTDTSCSKTIIGGGYGAGSVVGGNSSVTISGGAYSGNIYAGSYNGTVQGKATLTISGGTFAGAHLWGGNANGTKSLVFADNADLSDIAGISGFDSISILEGATVTVNSADILAVFTSRGYVTHDESAPYRVGIDICSWHDDNGTGTISSGWDYTPSIGSDAVMVLSQDTTLTIDAATTLGTVTLRTSSESPVTLTLEGSAELTATSLNLPANITLVYNSNRLGIGKITGEGVVLCDGFKPSADIGWSDDAEWHGTVWIKNISGGTSGNKGPAWDFNPDSFGNSNSVVRLTGVAGHFPQSQLTIQPALELVDEGDTIALKVNNGYSYSSSNGYPYARIMRLTGSGTLKCESFGDCALLNVMDASGFTGTVNMTTKGLYFGEGIPEASGAPQISGTIVINSGAEIALPTQKTWTAANGITINGTLNANGSISSSADVKVKGNGVVVYDGVAPVSGDGLWTDEVWTGTVWVKNLTNFTTSSFTPNQYGNANSVLRFTGCSGYITVGGGNKTEINVPFELLDDGNTPALTINNGSSNPANETSLAEIKGTGTLICNASADNVLLRFLKWDDFAGALTLTNKEVVFGNAEISSVTASAFVVSSGAIVNIPQGKTWTANGGCTVNGTLNVMGTLSSSSSTPIKGSGTVMFDGVKALVPEASWTGTNIIANVTYSVAPISAPIPLADLGNANSTIVLQGVKGYIENTNNITSTVVLRDSTISGREYGLNIDNGYSGRVTIFPKLAGDGKLVESHGGNTTATQRFVFSDATGFTGSISLSTGCVKRFIFGSDDSTIEAGTIAVKSGSLAVIGDGKTWTATKVAIAGTLATDGYATVKSATTLKNNAVLRFDSDDAMFYFDGTLTVENGDVVKLAFAENREFTEELQLVKWNGDAPAGNFAFVDEEGAIGWQLDKSADGLNLSEEPVEPDPEPPATPAVVDVLVAYDNGAYNYVTSRSRTLEEFAQTQIGKMNDVLATNRLDRYYGYRLAGVCKVDGTYTNIDTAPGLIAAGEGPAVSLRAAREIYGADTVTLLVDTTSNTIGNSSPLNSTNNVASQHECAFSVCSIRAVDTGKQHTMIHENAHNMGCGHARAQGIINSPFEYGRGYYFKDGNVTRHTIMAYGGDNDASWYFSTTSKEFGFTLGDATNNNARVLKETCGEVAKWREGAAIALAGVDVQDVAFATSALYPWSVEGDAIRSFNQTNYQYQCTTPLRATITGPKVLSFKHKSYFGGESVAGNNYSHFDVLLDDSPVLTQTECTNDWTAAQVEIPEGTHEVVFVFSQRFAMNNGKDYKDGTPEADDAVWLKDIAILPICRHTSTSANVTWTFPSDAAATSDYLDGIILEKNGIKETLNFGSTNAVVLSVLAELPEGKVGEIAGCKIYRSDDEIFHAFAYSNGDGTFSLGFADKDGNNTLNTATSKVVNNWKGLHIWTFAFGAQTGAKLYCDSELIAETTTIQWSNTAIKGKVSFGDDPRGGMAIAGMKIYAVDSDFGVGTNIFKQVDGSVNRILESNESLFATECVLRISEIMPKPTDDRTLNGREGMDVNGLESGWVEVENTSDQWADLKDYKFIRSNRGKKTGQADYGNFPSRLVAPHGRAIFYTSERYSNSADMSVSAWATPDEGGVKPKIYTDLGNILVWPDKVNPKKSPFVRLTYTPSNTIVDTVIIPSDVPEGYSIIVGETVENEATKRWLCPTPTRGEANTDTSTLTKIGPNVGPLYEISGGTKHDSASEFARPVPPATPGEPYEIVFSLNPVMSPTVAGGFRDEDAIASITLVYRTDLTNETHEVSVSLLTDSNDTKDWGHTYKAYIPADALPAAGHLVQWKFNITDASGNEWTSPSFNNPDDGYEWYGTIVEPDTATQMSATLPTWHMFASGNHLTQMDVDKDAQNKSLVPNYARIAIYDSSTSNYYDYVRIDLRGNTSAGFTKKGHGLRFAKAHPLTMTDVVTGEQIKEIRKTSLISEFADPSYMRQMMAFWLWRKMGNLVPFDFPVRCNMNGEFYQLAFNSERFTDELIEDVYGLDKFGYGYKNVGTLKSGTGTTAGNIEKKTPDDEDESNITVLQDELRAKITAAQSVSSSHDGGDTGLDNADLTKFVVQKFNLPAWLNYLASARITQEMDDVWANVCAYYDNAEMKEGVRGTDTWMPLGYDFNLSFGQYYYGDIKDSNSRNGLMSNQDWYKSHPFYGGNRVRCWKQAGMSDTCSYGNDGFEAVWQSAKFRRLYLRRLRTLMDQELKEPGTSVEDTPFMAKMREMADLMRDDAASDQTRWPNNSTDNNIDVWTTRPADMDAGINDIWNNYVVPRRQHLYVTHSVTNTAKTIGYGSNLNAGIPEAQSPISALAPNIYIDNLTTLDTEQTEALGVEGQFYGTEVVVIRNDNDEVVDMSGWKLAFSVDFTFPAGTVCDANDSIYIVADRRTYIEAHDTELTDQVIVGNATFAGTGPIALYAADGTLVYAAIPQTNELKYLRLHSFYGNTLNGGDAGEWFTLTNISDSVMLDLADVTVCFLKQGDDHDTTDHCHVTLTNKKGKGDVKPLKSWTARQSDYADKGWTKIQNNKQQITIYDKYGSVCQSLMVEQKKFPLAYGNGGYLVCDSTDASVTKNSQWHAALYELANDGELSEPFSAEDQEVATELVANAKPVLSDDDIAAGLETQYLIIVAEPVEGEAGKYKAVVDVNPATVEKPAVDTSSAEPMEIEDDTEDPDKKQVSVSISNATPGLWYGYEVSTSLGDDQNFQNDVGSFKRATSAAHKVTGSSRDKTETSAFFRVKVLPAKPTE